MVAVRIGQVREAEHAGIVKQLSEGEAAYREYLGDGNYGGLYQRPDEDMMAIWEVKVISSRLEIRRRPQRRKNPPTARSLRFLTKPITSLRSRS